MGKRPQRWPQPPPTYTSRGTVPDGYVTWNTSRPELRRVAQRHAVDCFVHVKVWHGTVRLGGKATDQQ